MAKQNLSGTLLSRLLTADVVCKDCGTKYGKYSVGCSSTWIGDCNVCGEHKPVTEVRDYGYLSKGIYDEKAKIAEQSKEVAEQLRGRESILSDEELDDELACSYERGEITCKFTEAEITALADVLDAHGEEHPPGWNVDYDSAFEKIHDLFEDYCVKYELSPALKAYYQKYGNYGIQDEKHWEGFRDAYNMFNAEE